MLPYWYGCFHDTDTYFCRALLESGRAGQAQSHLRYRFDGLQHAMRLAADASRSGALYPWQTDSKGHGQVHDVPMNSAIIAVEAWHHYAYSRCPEAGRLAAAIVAEVLRNLLDLLDMQSQPLALRHQQLMTFSETMTANDPTEVRVALRAVASVWLAFDSNQMDLNQWAARILAEIDLPRAEDGAYRLTAPGDAEPAYLRCPSVLLGSFPLHVLPADSALQRTFDKELQRIVFLFAWLPHQASIVASQLQRRDG
ncbi:MAG: hypothetical protein LR015_12050, partial [Verrucomicrobia bacterium]|nr:hypothetical protein [Verrucomicrobiota bacterium]